MNRNRHNILLVEDDADDRYIMHLAFSELGYEEQVKVFSSSEDFIRYLHILPDSSLYPSLVVLDYNMPGMNGGEVLMRMKMDTSLRDIPVAMYSTGIHAIDDKLISMGATYCFEKGSEFQEVFSLARTLRDIVESIQISQAV